MDKTASYTVDRYVACACSLGTSHAQYRPLFRPILRPDGIAAAGAAAVIAVFALLYFKLT